MKKIGWLLLAAIIFGLPCGFVSFLEYRSSYRQVEEVEIIDFRWVRSAGQLELAPVEYRYSNYAPLDAYDVTTNRCNKNVHGAHCTTYNYTLDEWQFVSVITNQGRDKNPQWPVVELEASQHYGEYQEIYAIKVRRLSDNHSFWVAVSQESYMAYELGHILKLEFDYYDRLREDEMYIFIPSE